MMAEERLELPKTFADRYQKASEGLDQLMAQYPGMEAGHHLKSHLGDVRSLLQQRLVFPMEVVWLDSPNEAQLEQFLAFFHISATEAATLTQSLQNQSSRYAYRHMLQETALAMDIEVYNSAHLPIRNTRKLLPTCKLVYWFNAEAPDATELLPIVLRLQSEGGCLIHIHACAEPLLVQNEGLKVMAVAWDRQPSTVEELLSSLQLPAKLPLLLGWRLVEGLEKISDAFNLFIAQQEKDLRTKKFHAQQEVNGVKQEEKANLREVFQQAKTQLQRDFNEFERGVSEQIQRLGQKTDERSLLAKVSQFTQQISHLDSEVVMGNVRMCLPRGTVETLRQRIHEGLQSQVDQDIFALKEFFKQVENDLQQLLAKHFMSFDYQPQIQLNLSRIRASLQEHVQFQQKYTVEKRKLQFVDYMKGAMAPFMALSSLFMLFMLLGTNLKREVSMGNKLITVPIILGVCGYSLRQFIRNTRAKEAQDREMELQRMQENLVNEAKGMIRKVSDDWLRDLTTAVREELNNFIAHLDQVFALAAEQHKERLQQNQRTVQRRLQGIEQRERSHQTTLRSKETYDRSLAQFKGEVTQQYHQMLQQL